MRKIVFILFLVSFADCSLAKQQETSAVNFFDFFLYEEGVSLSDCKLNEKPLKKIPFIYYEFYCEDTNLNGSGCFFAIPKDTSVWKISDEENKKNIKREEKYQQTLAREKEAVRFLFSQRTVLANKFDLYVFYVPQKYIKVLPDGLSKDDGTIADYYYESDNSIISVYQYKDGVWIKNGEFKSKGETTRTAGMLFAEKLLKKKFFQ